MEDTELQDELASIRSIMERSSKFISLSGLSGILAGVYALVGAAGEYFVLSGVCAIANRGLIAAVIAIAVLLASIITGYILSVRKAKQKGESIWNSTSRQLLFNVAVPLLTGGLVIIICICQLYLNFVVPAMLIFYGLALVNAGNFTFTDVKYLGLLDIALGLLTFFFPDYFLLFWGIGFGVLHIVYGSIMYLKYDR